MSVAAPDSIVSPFVRVTEIMHEIREQISSTRAKRAKYVCDLERSSILLPELTRLQTLVESVRLGATQVGSMPPVPQTVRGRIGAVLVALAQRALFWLTPQLHAFHIKVAAALGEQANATQAMLDDLREVHGQIAALKLHVAQLTEGSGKENPSEPAALKEHNWQV